MMSPKQIREKVKSIIQLPTLPAIALEVVEMVDNPGMSAARLGKVIATDQALTGKVLKIANSAFYGFPKKISTVDFAIIVLGFDALKEIVISVSLGSALQKKGDSHIAPKRFWDHAIYTGVIARKLARELGYRISGEVFVGGVLHDMGLSVLHQYFQPEFKKILSVCSEEGLTFPEAEATVLGVTHGDIGGWLAERWNFPAQLVEAISFHHTPGKSEENPELVALIHCADVLSSRICDDPPDFDASNDFDPRALALLGLDEPGAIDKISASFGAIIDAEVAQETSLVNELHS